MSCPTIDLIAGARPNFVKIAPLWHALRECRFARPRIVHTGQHYDAEMSDAFFQDLGLPEPDIHLGCGSGSHAEQTGRVMIAYEALLQKDPPDWSVVVGDVNSTLACALAAVKVGTPVAHLEAGLRSGDRTMPEEINRLAVDAIADLLWTPSLDANANLLREGIREERIEFVGNVMIDSLEILRPRIEEQDVFKQYGLQRKEYGVVTMHRPVNVDEDAALQKVVQMLTQTAAVAPLVFAVHPRTRARLEQSGLIKKLEGVRDLRLTKPLRYVHFLNLVLNAEFAITDSGGLQEETTYLGIPCLTVRKNTERPITVDQGTNRLLEMADVSAAVQAVCDGNWPAGSVPRLWDGKTAARVTDSLHARLSNAHT